MEFDEKKELETLSNIVINQIPSYTNMVNSANQNQNSNDCIFGMVYHSFVAKSIEYLKNIQTDTEQVIEVELTFEMMYSIYEIFNERVADIKQAIVSAPNF